MWVPTLVSAEEPWVTLESWVTVEPWVIVVVWVDCPDCSALVSEAW